MKRAILRPAVVILLVLAPGGCGSSGPGQVSEAGAPDGTGGDSSVTLELPPGGDGQHELGATLGAAEVRAGRVNAAEQLLSGIKVVGQIGDFKIYNDRVAFIIAAARPTDGYSPFGGELLDAQRVDGAGGPSVLGEVILGVGLGVVEAKTVGVINDGSDGGPALVRVIGETTPFRMLDGVLPDFAKPTPVYVVIDYVLEPAAEVLEIRFRLINKRYQALEVPLSALGIVAGDGIDFFTADAGFDRSRANSTQDFIGMVGQQVSYALRAVDKPLSKLISVLGLWLATTGEVKLEPAGEHVRRFEFAVTAGMPEPLLRLMHRRGGGGALPELSGKVLDPDGKPVPGARVHVRAPAAEAGKQPRFVTSTRADSAGAYAVELAPGDYLVTVAGDGRLASAEQSLTVEAGGSAADLEISGTATLEFEVHDGQGASLPAKLYVKRDSGAPQLPPAFNEPSFPGGAAMIVFHPGGPGTVALAPGSYTITASRGFEYEIETLALTVTHGQTATHQFVLERSVDTTGYMCGDFHIHAMWSPDSDDLYELKVAALAAEGLELPVSTEHEYIGDFGPAIAGLGLQKWMQGIVGNELTTVAYGHFNHFPITADDAARNRGALSWWGRSPVELFDDVRKAWPDAVLQVNHPRGPPVSGYFNYVGYDPVTGGMKQPDAWTTNFDAVEVFNASSFADNAEGTVRDWFSLLDRGLRVAATGNSDSHHAFSEEVGYPRTYVRLSTDDPAKANPSELAQAVKEQRVVVSGGAFITVDAAGKSMGDVVDASGGSVKLSITVQAPLWVGLDRLQVIVSGAQDGGEVAHQIVLDATTAKPGNPVVRYEGELELSASRDSWAVVVVEGNSTLTPVVIGRRPFAMSNPIYLDVDGNGRYDAPRKFE